MNVGVDINGTISAMPAFFRVMCRSLTRAGHHVYVITAAMPDKHHERDGENTVAGREAELTGLGFIKGVHYENVFLAWGEDRKQVAETKRRICVGLGVEAMFDNDPLNVRACEQVTDVLVPSKDPEVYR